MTKLDRKQVFNVFYQVCALCLANGNRVHCIRPSYYLFDFAMFTISGVGLVPKQYPTDNQPGWQAFSVGYILLTLFQVLD